MPATTESVKNVISDFASVGIKRSAYRARMTYKTTAGHKEFDGVDITIRDDDLFESDELCVALADLGYNIRRYRRSGTFRYAVVSESRMQFEFEWIHTDGVPRFAYAGRLASVTEVALDADFESKRSYESKLRQEDIERACNAANRSLLHDAEQFTKDPSEWHHDRLVNATSRATAFEQALRSLNNGVLYTTL